MCNIRKCDLTNLKAASYEITHDNFLASITNFVKKIIANWRSLAIIENGLLFYSSPLMMHIHTTTFVLLCYAGPNVYNILLIVQYN